jgi:hypothetical protein
MPFALDEGRWRVLICWSSLALGPSLIERRDAPTYIRERGGVSASFTHAMIRGNSPVLKLM